MPRARVRDVELYYEVHGSSGGPASLRAAYPVVLIMGLATDLHGWEKQAEAFARTRRVLVFDNRGVGRSDKPRGTYTTREMAEDAAALMAEVGFARAHVVGLSMGGMIAQELALAHGRRLASLALVATYGKAGDDAREVARTFEREGGARVGGRGFDLRAAMAAMEGGEVAVDPRQLMAFLMPLVFSQGFIDRERDTLRAFYERSLAYGFAPHGMAGHVSAVLAHDALARLHLIGAPTLVVTGSKDRLIAPRHSRVLAERIPGARLVEIEGGTHGMNMEMPERLNQVIGDWLAAND